LINAKLDPVRKQMPAKYTWQDLVAKAFSLGIDLCTHYWIFPETQNPFAYCVYGTAVSESICDVLTGETQILRTDILYDGGQTLNGTIDIGQAEGNLIFMSECIDILPF
jgi:xanthine dehydrogenase/oxidase